MTARFQHITFIITLLVLVHSFAAYTGTGGSAHQIQISGKKPLPFRLVACGQCLIQEKDGAESKITFEAQLLAFSGADFVSVANVRLLYNYKFEPALASADSVRLYLIYRELIV